ncbi:hypothetical protein SSP531S_38160 [Streptomyces spongiicola]|uniref:Uncharacterized protein n=1 Tax=Streptomyces spongiicola TaxID=1690221 RepID=A0A2S1Z7C6_9ACTN|nr:hypothetical protein [Streptomyces spongiicola]AWK12269.1 hypothetical protein DDQ41_28890 [Streptomyces spongiicola]GBQ02357.1 hypothetical protein SSP531S_38160 [Streptomyces spongiicola]
MAGGGRRSTGLSAGDLFRDLRREVREDRPAYTVLVRLITLGGRLPYEDGAAGLTERERHLLHEVMGDERLRLSAPSARDGDVFVAYSRQGKLSLLLRDELDELPDADILAAMRVGEAARERAEERHTAWRQEERLEQRELDRILRAWEREGRLTERLGQVTDWVERVETVLLYVGRRIYSRSDAASNTLLRDGILEGLAGVPVADWPRADRLFVAAAHLLFTAGGPVCFEEFNGRQLSALGLRRWLVSRLRGYAGALGVPVRPDTAGRPLQDLAAEAAALRTAVHASGALCFRRISAPAFGKREILAGVPAAERAHDRLPAALAGLGRGIPALANPTGLPAEALVSRAAAELALGGGDAEELLALIVMAAVLDLRADYGMSSAVRDLTRLGAAAPDRISGVLALRRPDFFCCVLPHPGFAGRRPEHELVTLLWSVSQRMQYNRWHFVPGNFTRAEVPARRHYFLPPTMPDLAEHADLWHGGHVAAGVRHSIRAPGAQLWREPLSVGGNHYRGGYDIRVARTGGPPFTRADLWTAVRYSGLVDAFWRGLACLERPPVISGFGGDWYRSGAWKRYVERGRGGRLPSAEPAR